MGEFLVGSSSGRGRDIVLPLEWRRRDGLCAGSHCPGSVLGSCLMPLLDHFHPPLSERRPWESFHTTWASALADTLNRDVLPAGYIALEQVHAGADMEIDVATWTDLA